MAQNRIRVQNALVQAGQNGAFHPVTYDPDTRLASVNEAVTEEPASVLANEVGSTFEDAVLHRMSYKRERHTWTFQLRLRFNREVSLEAFEEALVDNPIKLDLDVSSGLRQVTLELTESDPSHPTQQQSSTGTQVTYTFEASLSPA